MSGINKVFLSGRIGNVEARTAGETPVTNISVATSYGKGESEKTEWHRLVAFGKAAEILAQYAAKGDKIALTGRLQTRSYTTEGEEKPRYTTEVVVEDFDLTNKGVNSGGDAGSSAGASAAPAPADDQDDDIPF